MFTSVDKAIVALFGSLMFLAQNFFGWSFALPEGTAEIITAIGTTGLTWMVPNR